MGLTPFWSSLQRPVDELQFKSLPCWFQEREREVAAWSQHGRKETQRKTKEAMDGSDKGRHET